MFESFLKSGNAPVKLKVKISIKTKQILSIHLATNLSLYKFFAIVKLFS